MLPGENLPKGFSILSGATSFYDQTVVLIVERKSRPASPSWTLAFVERASPTMVHREDGIHCDVKYWTSRH